MTTQTQKYKTLEDEDLVAGIVKHKDEQMFAELYDRYANVIYNKGLNFTKSKEEAQDTTHDIFVKLFTKLHTFKGDAKFSTWLYSFVYNFYVNYLQRKLGKRKKLFVNTEHYEEIATEVSDEDIFNLKSDKLALALDKIDIDDKTLLLMKYQEDFTVKEIEEILEIGKSAVKMRLKRARSKVVEAYNSL